MNSALVLSGNVRLEIREAASGLLIAEHVEKNRVVYNGRNIVRDLLCNIDYAPNYMAIGEGFTAPDDLDVSLGNEFFRNAFTRTIPSASKVTYQLHVLATQANTSTWREIGLFRGTQRRYTTEPGGTPSGGGTLFARAQITPIAKDDTTTVTISWDINLQSVS